MGVLNLDDFTGWITWAAARQTLLRGARTIEPLHLLACAVHDDTARSGPGWQAPPPWVLDGVDVAGLRADLDRLLGPVDPTRSAQGSPRISADANDLVARSVALATGLGRSLMTPDLLVLALLEHPDVARAGTPRRLTASGPRARLDPPDQGAVATLPVGALGEAARRDLVTSFVVAQGRGAPAVCTHDLLVVLLGDRRAATRLLAAAGVDALLLRSTVAATRSVSAPTTRPLAHDRAVADAVSDAETLAAARASRVEPAHLLSALFRTDKRLRRDLRRAGLGLRALEQAVDVSLPTGDLLLPRGAHPDAALVEGLDPSARASWVRAQERARLLERPHVDTAHLLALGEAPGWLLAALREGLGVDVDEVTRQCAAELDAVPLPGVDSPLGILPLTSGAQIALRTTLRVALDRGAHRADAGDLLLGLLADREGLPARALRPWVATPAALRTVLDVRRP